jgi:hypothetical protein
MDGPEAISNAQLVRSSIAAMTSLTDSPSFAPTASVTDFPSMTPSESPSMAPSADSSEIPSFFPTESPSIMPTALLFSAAPSLLPTYAPTTTSPSLMPSLAPTRAPTILSSSPPTTAPTMQSLPIVIINSYITLQNFEERNLTDSEQYTICQAQAIIFNISIDRVKYVRSTPLSSYTHSHHKYRRLQTSSAIVAETRTTFPMVNYPEYRGNTNALYSNFVTVFTNAVNNGVFHTQLVTVASDPNVNTTAFLNSVTTNVEFSQPYIEEPSTTSTDNNKGLGPAKVAGTVVATIIGSMLIFYIVYRYNVAHRTSQQVCIAQPSPRSVKYRVSTHTDIDNSVPPTNINSSNHQSSAASITSWSVKEDGLSPSSSQLSTPPMIMMEI